MPKLTRMSRQDWKSIVVKVSASKEGSGIVGLLIPAHCSALRETTIHSLFIPLFSGRVCRERRNRPRHACYTYQPLFWLGPSQTLIMYMRLEDERRVTDATWRIPLAPTPSPPHPLLHVLQPPQPSPPPP